MITALVVLLALPASAQSGERGRMLRGGDWNQRIHAATGLGALGESSLPLLAYAARDADWQVRMTAVHEMGRVGLPALGALETVLRQEPCRHVRLTAVHWLGIMGPEASDALHRALSDESGMVRLMGRYWLKKDGEHLPERPEDAAASKEDLKACARSPQPARASWADGPAPAGPKPPEEPIDEPVTTKDPVLALSTRTAASQSPPRQPEPPKVDRASLKELDELLTASPGFGDRTAAETSGAAYASTRRAAPPIPDVKRVKDPATPELMPMSPAGFGPRPAPETSGAEIAADKGTAKMANDPLPVLLGYLKSSDAAKRARAADELGRRAAPKAVPALIDALKDRAPRVRASAALALGNIGAPADAAVAAIVAALKKGPEEVSWSAALALGRIGTPRARAAFDASVR